MKQDSLFYTIMLCVFAMCLAVDVVDLVTYMESDNMPLFTLNGIMIMVHCGGMIFCTHKISELKP